MGIVTTTYRPEELKNYAINGNFDFWQRATTRTFSSTSFAGYTADRVLSSVSTASSPNIVVSRSTDIPAAVIGKSQYSWLATSSTAMTLAAANYLVMFEHRIEGTYFRDIHQKTATFSFWFKASLAGNYSFSVRNGGLFNRSYVTTFNVAASNVWQKIAITVAMDTAGTYNLDNAAGLTICIAATAGTTYQTATLDSWQAGNFFAAATATNWTATAGTTIQVAQLMVNLGSNAAPFQTYGAGYDEELMACYRYCFATTSAQGAGWTGTGPGRMYGNTTFPVKMRAVPVLATTAVGYVTDGGAGYTPSSVTFNNVTDLGTTFTALIGAGTIRPALIEGLGFVADAEL